MLAVTLLPSDITLFFSKDATLNLLETVFTAVLRTIHSTLKVKTWLKENLFG